MNTGKLTEILKTFKNYQDVPNVPFLSKFTTAFIKDYLDKIGKTYTENKYGIIISPKTLAPEKSNFLIISHLDHPGIVLKNNHEGTFMGLIGTKALQNEVSQNKIPINIFSPKGDLIGKGKITKVDHSFKQKVEIETDAEVPINSFGQFDFDYFTEDVENIYAYNADDGMAVAIMLQTIKDMPETAYNVHYLFTSVEEIHQISSWNFAKTNYFSLGEKDFVLNLECLKIENIDTHISNANYENGVVLQLSNTGCMFGYKSAGENKTENLVKQAANTKEIKIQIGIIKDSCDSRPFTQFALTPNIATLTIPNKYKHDGADEGKITPEIIKKQDIIDFYNLLIGCLQIGPKEINMEVENLTKKLKSGDKFTDHNLMLNKALLNERLETAYSNILLRKHYYPENDIERLTDFILKGLSYLKYYFGKFLGVYKKLA